MSSLDLIQQKTNKLSIWLQLKKRSETDNLVVQYSLSACFSVCAVNAVHWLLLNFEVSNKIGL